MFIITIRTHGGECFEAKRDTLAAAQKYEDMLRYGGISLPGRWLNPSNILEVTIHEEDPEGGEAPKSASHTDSAPASNAGGRKPTGAVRRKAQA